MKKYSLALLCILALSACDSSSTTPNPSGDSSGGNADSGGNTSGDTGSDGGDTDGGDTGSGDGDTGSGDTGSGGGDTNGGDTGSGDGDTSGDDTGSGGGDASTCDVPALGHVFTQDSSVLTDGCIDTGMIDLAAVTDASLYSIIFPGVPDFDPDFDATNLPAEVKGLYLYTQGSAPGYVVPYTTVGF